MRHSEVRRACLRAARPYPCARRAHVV